MAVTATTVAEATTMLAAVATVFLTLVLCFYVFLCAKRYRGEAPADRGVAAWLRFLLRGGSGTGVSSGGGGGGAGSSAAVDGAATWRGLDEKSVAKLPRRVVAGGEPLDDCAVCIAELVAGDTARVLPRCGHGFHVDCVDPWLRSRSTCPLCRCPAVEEPPAPEADADSPNFPTNVLFFGSQDEVTTGRAQHHQQSASETTAPTQSQEETGLERLG